MSVFILVEKDQDNKGYFLSRWVSAYSYHIFIIFSILINGDCWIEESLGGSRNIVHSLLCVCISRLTKRSKDLATISFVLRHFVVLRGLT